MQHKDQVIDRVIETLVLDGKKADRQVAGIWADMFGGCSYDTFDEIWAAIASTRMPTRVEVLCALAGINPHEDWLKITQIVSGEIEEHTISGMAAHAFKKVGGLGTLKEASSYDAEQIRRKWWDCLDVGGTNAIMPAPVVLRLRGETRSTHDIEGKYPRDLTGEIRAKALLACLDRNEIKPELAASIAAQLPEFWRNHVHEVCEIIKPGSSRVIGRSGSASKNKILQKIGTIDAARIVAESRK